ncbi:hypothetical protein BBD42_21615 [Paenibacillus sp. BIHB 4019]|uniref:Zinc ribbon domain-containing protein n=1 Tax=Paenibacillus sp. BIHB 4019 TaxID=1870819 RepID=A0A1B2DM45_9BACL|nr:hypothetical protein [Paenibacillus sp. BIHB 4019]ANY68775.1 hypothetical protein BBD42_21615 [Paenibacillus sp. BIHB 4019]
MKHCVSCDKRYEQEVIYCGLCGKELEEVVDNKQDLAVNPLKTSNAIQRNKSSKTLKSIIAVATVLFFIAIVYFIFNNFISIDGQAKVAVNKYLSAIKNGDSTSDFKEYDVDDFINVLDYKFLRVIYTSKAPEQLIINEGTYDKFHKDDYQSFDEWKESMKKDFKSFEVISEDDQEMIMQSLTETYDKVTLLYDVTVTNGLGESVYKKANFIVKNDEYDGKFRVNMIDY